MEAPNQPMRIIHGRLIGYLRDLPIRFLHATACRPGNSPLKNAERHRKSRFFFLLDLKDAYRAVQAERLVQVLCGADERIADPEEVRVFLEQYCMSQLGGLAMGAPASPDLFNLYCAVLLDQELGEFSAQRKVTYTRYLDDLTFSADAPFSREARKRIRAVIQGAGFQVNHAKAELKDLSKGSVFINGVGLSLGGRIFVPRFYTHYLQGLLHQVLKGEVWLRPKVDGSMGVFLGLTNRRAPNKTEKRVLRLYQKVRRQGRSARRTHAPIAS